MLRSRYCTRDSKAESISSTLLLSCWFLLTPPTPYGVGLRVALPHFSEKARKHVPCDQRKRPLGARVPPRFLLQQSRRPMNYSALGRSLCGGCVLRNKSYLIFCNCIFPVCYDTNLVYFLCNAFSLLRRNTRSIFKSSTY